MIQGQKVSLRAVSRSDLPLLMEWRNQESFRQYFREYRELNMEHQENWFSKFVVGDDRTIMFSVVLNDAPHTLAGCCGLCYINWADRNADLSLYIGHQNAYIDQEGLAEEACRLLFSYGFGELGLHKIWTEIYEFDTPKKDLYTQLGFHQDGLLREQYFHRGRWWNARILSLLASEYPLAAE